MNLIRERTVTAALAALAVAGGLSACKSKDQYASADTSAVRSDSAAGSTDTSAMSKPALATPTPAPVDSAAAAAASDASIVGFALAANSSEITLNKLAETKATNPAVKAFARRMVTDHRAMLADVKSLSTKTNIMGDTTSGDAKDLLDNGSSAVKELTDKAAGADWDKNYIDKMIDGHQKVLSKLQDAAKNAANPDLRAGLEKAVGKVQQHLTKAQDIKANQLKA